VNFDKPAWLTKHREKAKEITPKWIEAVREIYGKLFLIEVYRFNLTKNVAGADAKYNAVGELPKIYMYYPT
jgi:hypothetical protein